MTRIAVFPGSFDPITRGHIDIVLRGVTQFDKVVIAMGVNATKKYLFTLEQRMAFIEEAFREHDQVSVQSYEGLTVDFCREVGASTILRGLRNGTDFDYECAIAQMNKGIAPEIETLFLMTAPELMAINSSIVRDLIRHGRDVSSYVPASVRLSD